MVNLNQLDIDHNELLIDILVMINNITNINIEWTLEKTQDSVYLNTNNTRFEYFHILIYFAVPFLFYCEYCIEQNNTEDILNIKKRDLFGMNLYEYCDSYRFVELVYHSDDLIKELHSKFADVKYEVDDYKKKYKE